MKINKENYKFMKDSIERLDSEAIKKHAKAVKESGKFKDFEKRMRWDLFWACNINDFVRDNLYPSGINDDHIDTALKNIVKELNIEY